MRNRRCHDRCQCLCHDTSGQVNTHPGSTCPGKWDMPIDKRNEAVDILEAAAFGDWSNDDYALEH